MEPFKTSNATPNNFYVFARTVTISGTTISTANSSYGLTNISGTYIETGNRFNITHVIGYR